MSAIATHSRCLILRKDNDVGPTSPKECIDRLLGQIFSALPMNQRTDRTSQENAPTASRGGMSRRVAASCAAAAGSTLESSSICSIRRCCSTNRNPWGTATSCCSIRKVSWGGIAWGTCTVPSSTQSCSSALGRSPFSYGCRYICTGFFTIFSVERHDMVLASGVYVFSLTFP